MAPVRVLLPVCAALAACLPIPDRIYETPEIHGELTANGAPLADDTVFLADLRDGGSCLEPDATVVTDSAGRFVFEDRSRLAPFTFLMGHMSQEWELCTRRDDVLVAIVRVFDYVLGGGMPEVSLYCDVGSLSDSTLVVEGSAPWNTPWREHAPCGYVFD